MKMRNSIHELISDAGSRQVGWAHRITGMFRCGPFGSPQAIEPLFPEAARLAEEGFNLVELAAAFQRGLSPELFGRCRAAGLLVAEEFGDLLARSECMIAVNGMLEQLLERAEANRLVTV